MTEAEFFSELSKVKGRFHFESGGAIRQRGSEMCPILAVARKKGVFIFRSPVQNSTYMHIAKKLLLPGPLALAIALAADNTVGLSASERRMRAKILSVTGLVKELEE